MKVMKASLLAALVLVQALALGSCSSSREVSPGEILPGIWSVSEINTNISVNPELIKRGEEEIKKASIIINQDGTGSIVTGDRSKEGRWSLSEDSKSLILNDLESGNKVTARIVSLNSGKMVLETKIMGGTIKAELIKKEE